MNDLNLNDGIGSAILENKSPYGLEVNYANIQKLVINIYEQLDLQELGFIPDLEIISYDKAGNAIGYAVFRNQIAPDFNIYLPFFIKNDVFENFDLIIFAGESYPFSMPRLYNILLQVKDIITKIGKRKRE
jgi:hypothetical protein